MELPAGAYVKTIDGQTDLAAFTFPFLLEGKALDDGSVGPTVEELEDGDLIIEGWAADFDGEDRQGENFIPGAFERGVKSFLSGTASLNFHHKHDHVLGKVLNLEQRETPERKGLWMRARVDGALKNSPLAHIYHQIRRGTLSGLSVGGFFKRVLTPKGWRIGDVDMTEISVTNVPIHSRPNFAVVAGKALEDLPLGEPESDEPDLTGLSDALASLAETFQRWPEGKALPKSHDPGVASWLSDVIGSTARLRSLATTVKDVSEHSDLKSLADDIETAASGWEARGHRLAAKVGPLPPPPAL